MCQSILGGVPNLLIGEGVPHQALPNGEGTPSFLTGGNPLLPNGDTPILPDGGYPGVPLSGLDGVHPLSGLDGGYPLSIRTRWGTAPPPTSGASTCYTAGSMPLAFTQDFLVLMIFYLSIGYQI